MRAALRGSHVEYVTFMGETEFYPAWFAEELYDRTYTDESRFTFWVPDEERRPDYYEKQLIEDYSIILRKPNGGLHVTTYEAFDMIYERLVYCGFRNYGIAAPTEDCIEYVECQPGVLPAGYPEWFYEFFTEALNFPESETVLFYDTDKHCISTSGSIFISVRGEVSIIEHCVFLRNRFGEIRAMLYDDFFKYYDPYPELEER